MKQPMTKQHLSLLTLLLLAAIGCGGPRGAQDTTARDSSAAGSGDGASSSAMTVVDSARLRTGIAAEVRQRPTRPIENEDDIPWAPLPGAVVIVEDKNNAVLGKVKSDANGKIYLELAPGTHYLRPQPFPGKMFPHPLPSQRVYVSEGEIVRVVLEYDTGIR